MMRASGGLKSEDADNAAWEAGKGAVVGATKVRELHTGQRGRTNGFQWGAFAAVLGGAGYAMSPIYRGLTFQFKV